MTTTTAAVLGVTLVIVVSAVIATSSLRWSRTTSDFYVASRAISPRLNASAISGEYLSGASFLGVAGLVLAYGADMLWYPVGYTAGYLVLLALVAAPLRRSGAYTVPDFAEARLESRPVRHIASGLVVLVGWFYLLPQFQGAGLALRTVTGAPAWLGGVLVGLVVLVGVLAGGMRSITLAQAFQYWLKLTALAVPVIALALAWHADGAPSPVDTVTRFRVDTTVSVPSALSVEVTEPVSTTVTGVLDGREYDDRPVRLDPGRHTVAAGARLTFAAGAAVPHEVGLHAASGRAWAEPLHPPDDGGHPMYATYSLMLATFLGTMGLPHVVVRFYTNPDGRAARRTTLTVIGLLSAFYLLPPLYGALGRVYTPDLLMTGRTDATVLTLPARVIDGPLGIGLTALVAAGAFAAFLSTSSGLTVAVAGVLSQDVLRGGVRDFRGATVLAVVVPMVLSLTVDTLNLADAVGMAFAVAASSFCPLLVLGIWWTRLTDAGAAAGLIVGGGLSSAAVVATVLGQAPEGWAGALVSAPAAWSVPLSFLVMVVVSLLTPGRAARDVSRMMVRLHTPEAVAVDRGPYHPERTARRRRSPAPTGGPTDRPADPPA